MAAATLARIAGLPGALATSAAFITPAFLLLLAVAAIYVRYSGLAAVQSLFYGIAPAVMAIIAIAPASWPGSPTAATQGCGPSALSWRSSPQPPVPRSHSCSSPQGCS
jgi:chromate transporter